MKYQLTLLLLCLSYFATSQIKHTLILNEQERATVVNDILEDRLDNLLPQLMRRSGIDMWIIISREYNEDPVMKTMLPATWLSARRRTILVFYDAGGDTPLEKIAIARYDVGKLLKGAWDCLLYTSPSPRDRTRSRMPSSA